VKDQELKAECSCRNAAGRKYLTLRTIALAALCAVLTATGSFNAALAQTINWSDPQSPILKAVVTHQRLANEREVGDILVLRGEHPFAAVTRMTLVSGDSLITGDQTAIIGYADQSWEAVVHPNTQVDFRGGQVQVTFGRMFVQLTASEQGLLPIAVTSKFGSVTSGTASYEIDVSEARAVIAVIAGAIELSRPSSDKVSLRAFDEAVLIADAPVVTRPIDTGRFATIGSRIATLANLGVVSSPGSKGNAASGALATTAPDENPSSIQRDRNREAQRRLTQLGYDAGTADGVAGARTLRAVAAFRLDRKLSGTTEIDEALLAALREASDNATDSIADAAKPAAQNPQTQSGARIPDVVGLDFDKARLMLIQGEQLIGRVTYEPGDDILPGVVLRQFPPPGSASRQGTSVDMVVARSLPPSANRASVEISADAATDITATLTPPPPPPLPPTPQAKPAVASGGSTGPFAEKIAAPGAQDDLSDEDLSDEEKIAGLFRPDQKLGNSGTAGTNALNREELSACLRIEDDYLAQKLRASSSSRKQDATADEIAALDVKLDEVLPETDPGKPETLEAYNSLLDKRHRLFSDYKDRILPQARQDERRLQNLERNFRADCGQRPYRPEDMEAVRKEASVR
jgi:peptidoglycan hydrolase-like protein with peptidoglycan-binding domain